MIRSVAWALSAALFLSALTAGVVPASAARARASSGTHVVTGELGGVSGAPLSVAADALARFEGTLGIDASQFRFDEVRHSLAGTHIRGAQFRSGVRIENTSAAVHIVDGRIVQVEAHGSDLPGQPGDAVGVPEAIRAALAATGVVAAVRTPRVSRVMTARNGRLVDVYLVPVLSLDPPVALTVEVSADGAVLGFRDELRRLRGRGRVFDPNPIVALADSSLRQLGEEAGLDTDLDSPELTEALSRLPLKQLDETALTSGRLTGPWVDVVSEGEFSLDGRFDYTRSDPRFEAVMSYAHIDRFQRYLRSLGFRGESGVNDESQRVIALPVYGFDNSFYQPGNDVLLFGAGGVDDAEDAEVILHEYGHAMQDAQVDGWGQTADGGAMGEGFGDFIAGAYYALHSDGYQDACVADWDATSYSSDDPPCLRRLDSKKRYPDDLDPAREVHADGEIWSAFLWRLRSKLGRTRAAKTHNSIKLVVLSHEFLTPQAKFGDAVAALRLAAKALGHRNWGREVVRAARRTGLPLRP